MGKDFDENNGFFRRHTGMSYYDSMLDNDKMGENYDTLDYYRFEKGIDYDIVYMTPTEYIHNIADKVFKKPVSFALMTNKDTIIEYAKRFRAGELFDMPVLDLCKDHLGQEGRHRMLAIKLNASLKEKPEPKVPVMVIFDSRFSDEEAKDYALRKWGEKFVGWGFRYITGRDLNESPNTPIKEAIVGDERCKYVFKIDFRLLLRSEETGLSKHIYSLGNEKAISSALLGGYLDSVATRIRGARLSEKFPALSATCEKIYLYTPFIKLNDLFYTYIVFVFKSPIAKSELKKLKEFILEDLKEFCEKEFDSPIAKLKGGPESGKQDVFIQFYYDYDAERDRNWKLVFMRFDTTRFKEKTSA